MEKKRIDPQWVEKARNGDQDAITALYTASYQTVYITIKSMLRADEADVLDILQESYIKAFQNIAHLKKTESFLPWMTSIARHATLDHLKKSKLLLFTELANDEGENYFEVADEDIGNLPEDALDQQETARLLQQIVDSLPTGERVAVAMFYYQEMSIKQIATALGRSEGTIKAQLSTGRRHIEAKVRELEAKEGVRLYSVAPIGFFVFLLRHVATAEVDANATILANVLRSAGVASATTTVASATVAGSVAETTTTTAVSVTATTATEAVSATVAGSVGKAIAGAGAKALASKITAGVLAVALVGGGTIVALQEKDADIPEPIIQTTVATTEAPTQTEPAMPETPPTQEETEETIPPVQIEPAYAGILNSYYEVLSMDSETYEQMGGMDSGLFNADHVMVRYCHMGSVKISNIFYALYDINGDGVEELLVGRGDSKFVSIVDVYTLKEGEAIEVIDEPTLSDRSRLYIMPDGTMVVSGSGGASISHYTFFEIQNNLPSEIYSTTLIYEEWSGGPSIDGKLCSEEEVSQRSRELWQYLDDAIPNEDFDWKSLEEFIQQNGYANDKSEDNDQLADIAPAYEDILHSYYEVLSLDYKTYQQMGGVDSGLFNADHITVQSCQLGMVKIKQIYYAFYDINADGVEELLIGEESLKSMSIVDVYTLNEGETVEVIDEPTLGGRSQLYIKPDGTMVVCERNGAITLNFTFIKIQNNLPAEIYSTDLNYGSEYYTELVGGYLGTPSIDGKPCSEEEVSQRSRELWQYVGDAIPSEDFEWYSLESFVHSDLMNK